MLPTFFMFRNLNEALLLSPSDDFIFEDSKKFVQFCNDLHSSVPPHLCSFDFNTAIQRHFNKNFTNPSKTESKLKAQPRSEKLFRVGSGKIKI